MADYSSISLKHFRAYLLDLDGVIYRGEQVLPGARELVEWIDATGRKALYLSNNSIATPDEVATKLKRLGMPRPEGRVFTAGLAAAQMVADRFPHGSVYVLGMPSVEEMAETAGLRVIRDRDQEEQPDAVLVGLDRTLTYKRLRRALRAIMAGAAFFAVNRDPRLPVEDGYDPGTGAIAAALEYSSGKRAEIAGKPAPGIVLEALGRLGVTPDETLMVGDGLDLDVVAGHAAGVTTALVLTGLTTAEQAQAATGERKPDLIYPDLTALLRDAQAQAHARR
ncbi:MAG: HAD-IIA family hydrolase [Ktedonobacterales bacterium]